MTDFRYKAFISYSHRDERWGQWLHKALESYRVPRRLVGSPGRFGEVPARVAPVFRDREDLSSASDLSTRVREELKASESLVVICSPASAASPWVNEEIRYFKSLGRAERIMTLIVDGDPKSADPESRCFPPALTEGEDGEQFEPLGTDARKWADGKSLARLKLVSGILGLRLDDLRQRDMQRKHRLWMISAGGAFAIAILTSVLAVMAITARDQAETRRQHAEDLVDYMVDDLKEKLDEVGRLDILEDVGGEVSKYLETLNPQEESEESLLQKAKVLRQLGEVGMGQGTLDDSMRAFQASRDVTAELLRRQPDDEERIFEMGQAEFWVGYVHLEKGAFDSARSAFDEYLRYSTQLTQIDPENTDWIMEQSYAHGNIAALIAQSETGDVPLALEQISASVELNRMAIELEPENQDFASEYSEALAWQADTQMMLCDLDGALGSRQENLRIARLVLQAEPANVNRKRRLARSLSGLANVERFMGQTEEAVTLLEESAQILGELYLGDRSNVDFRWDELHRQTFGFILRAELGKADASRVGLENLYDPMQDVLGSENEDYHHRRKDWISYLLRYSDVAWMAGEKDRAEQSWMEAIQQMVTWMEESSDPDIWRTEVILARFLAWQYWDEGLLVVAQMNLPEFPIGDEEAIANCEVRYSRILQSLLHDQMAEAQRLTDELMEKGFYEASFIRVCRQNELCRTDR